MLPRERRVLKDTAVSALLERLTGLTLGADDLRLIVSGCLVDGATPADGRQFPGGWQAVTIGPERVAYLRTVQGRPTLVAADYGPWRVDYSQHAGGFPRAVACDRALGPGGEGGGGHGEIDITARVEQLEVNTDQPACVVG